MKVAKAAKMGNRYESLLIKNKIEKPIMVNTDLSSFVKAANNKINDTVFVAFFKLKLKATKTKTSDRTSKIILCSTKAINPT